MELILSYLQNRGIIVDIRRPDILRVTPTPLYDTFRDVWQFVRELGKAIESVREEQPETLWEKE